ncbi:nicotinate-nucleotide pyrophosphorylase [carboxylating] [Desulfotomaculum arcticum]|uniref:Probable nicotinate-nucleotide pyrophosphorylase [carboxylating] n=2 Tax=Desulfotruncus TaxID=2867377 RepID=A0A1I2V429_9FIRM|nr:nicotinate-nucleotide pyrophosphorylase [carboxylating] [Desulfotomaculum arcticum] [Desulfotruncus arcticus DSM 17038]
MLLISMDSIVKTALAEDLGRGDVTSSATIPPELTVEGYFICKSPGVVAGLPYVQTAFRLIDPLVRLEVLLKEGAVVADGDVIAKVVGNARSILASERVALNFLQHLSGIATTTAAAVEAARPYHAVITDTRKTTPGLRMAEKYAVTVGGGKNHRLGLDDGILIKDNHIKAAGGIKNAIDMARRKAGHLLKIEIETETLAEVREAVECGADVILLDNMSLDELRASVKLVAGRALTEASGGITPAMVADIAATGVDIISLGWITHSALPLDISLELS